MDREMPRKDGLGHQDNVDGPQGLEGKLEAEQSKTIKQGTFYSSSDSDMSSSDEEILAASRTEVEDGSSGEREVVFNIDLNLFHLTLLIIYILKVVWVDLGTDVEWARGSLDKKDMVRVRAPTDIDFFCLSWYSDV